MCLCANAVLKWAHYHQREHKHSSRKQDSLCQEREPLPQAHCRPDEITRLKIRQGSYYYCRHAPQAAPALRCWRRQSTQLLKHSLSSFFFWLQLVLLSSSIKCLPQVAGGSRCVFVRGDPLISFSLWWFTIVVSVANFPVLLSPAGAVIIPYRNPCTQKCHYIIHNSPFWVQ